MAIGYGASRRTADIRDYFVGGKELGFINVAFSARATDESAWLLLGLTGMGYSGAVHAFWVELGEVIGAGGAWLTESAHPESLVQSTSIHSVLGFPIRTPSWTDGSLRRTSGSMRSCSTRYGRVGASINFVRNPPRSQDGQWRCTGIAAGRWAPDRAGDRIRDELILAEDISGSLFASPVPAPVPGNPSLQSLSRLGVRSAQQAHPLAVPSRSYLSREVQSRSRDTAPPVAHQLWFRAPL